MIGSLLAVPHVLAARGDLARKLMEGDPVAWVCLVIGIVVVVGIKIIKNKIIG
jgi:hypothetical protein